MQLRTIVRIRRRVVTPEQVAGRRAMIERHYWPGGGVLSVLLVLVSRAVPMAERAGAGDALLRAHAHHILGNDNGTGGAMSFPADAAPVSARL